MKVRECMTREVRVANPSQTLQEAARLMAELDVGVLPVGENDRLVGMVTDRDIVIRGVASGMDLDTPISEVMSDDVLYCFEDQTIDEVTRNMGDSQVRRLPVVNRSKRLVGIVSLGDVVQDQQNATSSATALRDISEPSNQSSIRH